MELLYKKAEIENIEALIDLKIKQDLYNCNVEGRILKNEDLARQNIRDLKCRKIELDAINPFFVVDSNHFLGHKEEKCLN